MISIYGSCLTRKAWNRNPPTILIFDVTLLPTKCTTSIDFTKRFLLLKHLVCILIGIFHLTTTFNRLFQNEGIFLFYPSYKLQNCLKIKVNNTNVFFIFRRKLSATQTNNPQIVQIHISQTDLSISLKLIFPKLNSCHILSEVNIKSIKSSGLLNKRYKVIVLSS